MTSSVRYEVNRGNWKVDFQIDHPDEDSDGFAVRLFRRAVSADVPLFAVRISGTPSENSWYGSENASRSFSSYCIPKGQISEFSVQVRSGTLTVTHGTEVLFALSGVAAFDEVDVVTVDCAACDPMQYALCDPRTAVDGRCRNVEAPGTKDADAEARKRAWIVIAAVVGLVAVGAGTGVFLFKRMKKDAR
jgi:hypothetical protein